MAKWATSPHPFTALRLHLAKFLDPAILDETTAKWFHDALGFHRTSAQSARASEPVGAGCRPDESS